MNEHSLENHVECSVDSCKDIFGDYMWFTYDIK